MSRPSAQHLHSRCGENDCSKGPSFGAYRVHSPFQEFAYGQEDSSSRPNTPSMTNGSSSRSNSSSIITCDWCGNPEAYCTCQSQIDSKSLQYQPSEAESLSLATSTRQRPGKAPRSHHSHLRDVVDAATLAQSSSTRTNNDFKPYRDYPIRDRNDQVLGVAADLGVRNKLLKDAAVGRLDQTESNAEAQENELEAEPSDTETGDDDESDEDLDEDEDNDWSGQDDNLEVLALKACGGDLVLAAQVIPMLHKSIYSGIAENITSKVGPWRRGITVCPPPGGRTRTSDQSSTSKTGTNESSGKSRKRQRRSSISIHDREREERDEEDDEDDEDKRGGKGRGDTLGSDDFEPIPRLACPFHKHNPTKYSIQHGSSDNSKRISYRSCGGPGFKSIQRLKEHLKRTHYPVQCDRCYEIFPGSDRAACVRLLETHRQLPIPCERRDWSMKEGISDAQWASMDKKKSNKQKNETSKIEKWQEIWVILFPGFPCPETPWYDQQIQSRQLDTLSQENSHCVKLFKGLLQMQVSQRHIRFAEGSEQEMISRIVVLAHTAFAVQLELLGFQSSTTSTSTGSREQPSSFDGSSFVHVSRPTFSSAQGSSFAPRSSTALSQVFLPDAQIPTGSRGPSSRAPETPMGQMVQNYVSHELVRTMSANHNSNAGYQMGNSNNAFASDQYQEPNFAPPAPQWGMGYEGAENTFNRGHTSNSLDGTRFGVLPVDPLSQTLVDASQDGQRNLADLRGSIDCQWQSQHI